MTLGFILVLRPVAAEVPPALFFPLQERWSTNLGQPAVAPPAYDHDHAYVPLRDGTLSAVTLVDGSIAWSVTRPTHVSPAVGDGIVVVADKEAIFGLRTADATPVWTTDVGAIVSAPLVWNNGWLVAVLQSGDLVVLRGADGFVLWRQPVSGGLEVRPSIAGNELFLPVLDGRVIAFDLETGERLWERTLGGSPQEILALDDLFVGATDNYFYRLSRANGRMLWRWRTGGDIIGLPAVDERQVIFVSLDNILRALDRESGVQQWRRPLPGRPTGGPQLVANLALVSGVAPRVRAFDTLAGENAGVLTGPGELAAPPHILKPPALLAPGVVVLTGDGRLVGLLAPTGPPRFPLDFPPPPLLPHPELLELDDVVPLGQPLLPEPPPPLASPLQVTPVVDGADGPGAVDPDPPGVRQPDEPAVSDRLDSR